MAETCSWTAPLVELDDVDELKLALVAAEVLEDRVAFVELEDVEVSEAIDEVEAE